MIVVLMGVSGSGKTTIGEALQRETGAVFADADDFHSAENKAKMAAGHALDDADRQPWLKALNELMIGWHEKGIDAVLACSALKEQYRTTLEATLPKRAVRFVLLDATREMIAGRLAVRKNSFMNPSLLESQLQTLERSHDTWTLMNDRTPAEVAHEIAEHVGWGGKA